MEELSILDRWARKDDPHTMTKAKMPGRTRWERRCTCGWRATGRTREIVMEAAADHRLRVLNHRRLVRLGLAEFYTPPPPRPLTDQEKGNMRVISEGIRRAFGGL